MSAYVYLSADKPGQPLPDALKDREVITRPGWPLLIPCDNLPEAEALAASLDALPGFRASAGETLTLERHPDPTLY